MDRKQVLLDDGQMARQREFTEKIHAMHQARGRTPLALVDTFGCQQNVADSQHILGMLRDMGCEFTDDAARADIVVMNTCAIRDHAEKRVYGTLGALTHTKKQNPEQVICLCGCMAQRPEVAEKVRTSYRHVDLVFGPQALWKFPELLYQVYTRRGRVFSVENEHGSIAEGMPVVREGRVRAWVSIMYGCNNFCSYCIVPYVRGRERSRAPEKIVEEVRQLAAEGFKEITLLGQNVNSYGKDLPEPWDFADLLRELDKIEGDYLIRFMSSQPKDATPKLFDTMAQSRHVAHQLHLPVQSGSDRVLRAMNRPYDRAKYLDLIGYARKVMPDLVLTSDVIIGFPGETEAEAMETVDLVRQVEFDALFTFIFSPPARYAGGQNGRSGAPGGEAEVVRHSVQHPERDFCPAPRRVCGPDPAGAGGRRNRRRPVAPVRPDGGGTAGAPGGGQVRPGPVSGREDHRQQHLGPVRGDASCIKRTLFF